MSLTKVQFQKLLINNGYPLPKYGADGDWGGETEAACELWFDSNKPLLGVSIDASEPVEPEPPPGNLVPADWMPDCAMKAIIIHWSAGAYTASESDKEHYHIIVESTGKLVRGDYSIKANVSTSDADGYAAHTSQANTGRIGIAVACMAGAIESPFNPGKYPMLESQWLTLAKVAAELCHKYKIAVTPTTVLSHGEVQKNLGIPQSGKWDINKLPWEPSMSYQQANDLFRGYVKEYM